MSFKEWMVYVLKKFVSYVETPRIERKALKASQREPWSVRWFGMIPFSLKMEMHKQRSRWKRR
jgi:hypothetical protein